MGIKGQVSRVVAEAYSTKVGCGWKPTASSTKPKPECTGVMPGTVDRDSSLQNLGVRGREWIPSGEEPGVPSFLKHLYQEQGSSDPVEGEPMKTVSLLASLLRTHLPGKVLHLGRGQ